jgi:2-oxoisovalerate dehydrogenase E2 component (dihydrolipoyl transacylase)
MWKSKQWLVAYSRRLSTSSRPPPHRMLTVATGTSHWNSTKNSVVAFSQNQSNTNTTKVLSRVLSTALVSDSSSSSSSNIPFLLADIGEGIAEVELLQWFVQEGDPVRQFDRVCEVQSDKATVEITSRYDGRITSLEHGVGEMVKVGSPLLFLDSDDEDHHATTTGGSLHLHTASTQTEPLEYDEQLHIPTIASQYHLSTDEKNENEAPQKVLTSPAIRKLAKEYSLDLSTIVGAGPKGRVLKGDVLTVLKERGLITSSSDTNTSPMPSSASSKNAPSSSPNNTPTTSITSMDQAVLPLQQDTTMAIRGYNRLMVQSMTASLQIPHMVYADEINVNQLMTHKAHLPFLPFCIKAASQAMAQYPLLNASYNNRNNNAEEEEANNQQKPQQVVTLWKDHNIGIAMDTPRGLIVPVVRQVQDKSLQDIAQELRRLKELAKEGAVPAEDLQGATFTLSNIGAIGGGGTYMSPIVTAPQVAVGALGKIQRLPRFVGDTMEVEQAHICTVSWGGDHRVVDGATMARFHSQWKEYIQNPMTLIQEMK